MALLLVVVVADPGDHIAHGLTFVAHGPTFVGAMIVASGLHTVAPEQGLSARRA